MNYKNNREMEKLLIIGSKKYLLNMNNILDKFESNKKSPILSN